MEAHLLYRIIAPIYGPYVTVGSLGAFPSLYRRIADTLRVRPGGRVLDLCCGTGNALPYLREKVGPTGVIVGVDGSERMLGVARARLEVEGLGHVDLRCEDIREYEPASRFDAVVMSICLSGLPSCEEVLLRVSRFLEPGGHLVIVDSFLNRGRWHYRLSNLYNRVKGRLIGARPDNRIREVVHAEFEGVEEQVLHGGIYNLISCHRPRTDEAARVPH